MFICLLPSMIFHEDYEDSQGLYVVVYDQSSRYIPDLVHATLMQRPTSSESDASFGWNPTPYTW